MKKSILILLVLSINVALTAVAQGVYLENIVGASLHLKNKSKQSDFSVGTQPIHSYGIKLGYQKERIAFKVGVLSDKSIHKYQSGWIAPSGKELNPGWETGKNIANYITSVLSIGYGIVDKNKFNLTPFFNVVYSTLVSSSEELTSFAPIGYKPSYKSDFITVSCQVDVNYDLSTNTRLFLAPNYRSILPKSGNEKKVGPSGGYLGAQIGLKLKV